MDRTGPHAGAPQFLQVEPRRLVALPDRQPQWVALLPLEGLWIDHDLPRDARVLRARVKREKPSRADADENESLHAPNAGQERHGRPDVSDRILRVDFVFRPSGLRGAVS